jgi:hypothetical protein
MTPTRDELFAIWKLFAVPTWTVVGFNYTLDNIVSFALNKLPIYLATVPWPISNNDTGYLNWGKSDPTIVRNAVLSAIAMMRQRNQIIRDTGNIPDVILSTANLNTWGRFYVGSVIQFTRDMENLQSGQPAEWVAHFDIYPVSPEQLSMMDTEENMRALMSLEQNALTVAQIAGRSAADIALMNAQTVTDPLGRLTTQQTINQAAGVAPGQTITQGAVADPHLTTDIPGATVQPLPVVSANINLPSGPNNQITPQVAALAALDQFQRISSSDPLLYRVNTFEQSEQWKQLTDYLYWQQFHPTVAVLAADNPHIDSTLLNTFLNSDMPWNAALGLPPLVNVKITPQVKPRPTLNVGYQIMEWVGPILNVIPVIGTVLSIVSALVVAQGVRDFYNSFTAEPDIFKPQYDPVPFWCPLPLDRAKIALQKPWFIAAMVQQFRQEALHSDIQSWNTAYQSLAAGQLGFDPDSPSAQASAQTPVGQVTLQSLLPGTTGPSASAAAINGGTLTTPATGTTAALSSGTTDLLALAASVAFLIFESRS